MEEHLFEFFVRTGVLVLGVIASRSVLGFNPFPAAAADPGLPCLYAWLVTLTD